MKREQKKEAFANDGVLVIDKPEGWTSHDVVARVRKILKTRRVGHTGTLDPFATGVLVVCVNRATRLVQFLTGDDKEYLATVRFGYATDTGDLTGQPLTPITSTAHINTENLEVALTHLRGRIKQVPPMYSAKKVGGVKLYELARRGETIEREAVEIEIKKLELCSWPADESVVPAIRENADGTRECDLRVLCTSGTYIRVLAEDIGKRLNLGAHLTRLCRTRAGNCSLAQAITLEELEELALTNKVRQELISMSEALTMPEVSLSENEQQMIKHGRAVKTERTFADQEVVKLTAQGLLIAIAKYQTLTHSLHPCSVLISSDPALSES
ncbi:MAG TPA: tRNA pseudouridine(55) synthase TruB [Blastocatellia bacterium]|nr:tRNA pseudouridine(55) synthase TruB [Blastocatellia bacterium]